MFISAVRFAIVFLIVALRLSAQISVLTYQYDLTRDGVNTSETILTPSNVISTQFGKLFSDTVDGAIFAQPLYMARLNISGGVHNVVFVATEHDSVYAFDADSPQLLWHDNFLNPAAGVTSVPASDTSCNQIQPEIGITGTPVIDPSSNTLYVVAMTKENGNYVHRLHALDATTGAEKSGSPVVIQASVPGTGDATGNTVTLIPKSYKQRPGLLLLNGIVYVGMSSHCDIGTYHGWLLGYDARTLNQTYVFNVTPNGTQGSFWGGGAAPAADSSGNIYVVSANGSFDAASGGSDYGESYIKLSTANGLQVTDYFTPFNYASLDSGDLDTGSSGVVLLGDEAGSSAHPHLMAGAGKEGRIYLLDRDNLGKWQPGSDNQVVQSISKAVESEFGNPAYFNKTIYFCAAGDNIRAFPVNNAALGAVSISTFVYPFPGCVPTISSNGTSNGVLWTLDATPALRAYDPSNISTELYDSTQNSTRDSLGSYVKFSAPTVANGKVYAGTQNSLVAYGLLTSPLAISNAAAGAGANAAPGSLIQITGSNLASSTASAPGFPLPPSLAGASVTINGISAPILYASATQINAQVPFEISPGAATVNVTSGNSVAGTTTIAVQGVAPGLFNTSNHAAVVNSDGSVNSDASPASAGKFIAAYLTGLGAVNNPVATGAAASANPLSTVTVTVTATLGGLDAQVVFAGLAPGYAGLYQVNLMVPQLATGDYPLQVSANGVASNPAQVSVR